MTSWRLAAAVVLAAAVGVPLALPFLDLLRFPSAWLTWQETGRLLSLGRNTLLLVAGALALALPLGVALAVLLYRTDLPGRRALRFLVILTLFVPLPLFASGWQAALGVGGWLSWPAVSPTANPPVWAPWSQGLFAAIWVHAVAGLPWVVVLVGQGLCWVERELEEDALTTTGPWGVLWHVTLRRSLAAVGAATLWVALQTATEITVTDMVQVRTFAEEVYTQYVRPEPDERAATAAAVQARAVAVSVPQVLLAAGLILFAVRRWEGNLPPLVTSPSPPLVFGLGRWRWPCLAWTLVVFGVLVGVPVVSLIWKVGLAGRPPAWSLAVGWQHLSRAARLRGMLVLQSLGSAAVAGAVTAGLALVVCWLLTGAGRWFRGLVLVVMAAAWALPAPVIGLGLNSAILGLLGLTHSTVLDVLLYRGPSPIPLWWAYLIRFFPFAVALLWPVVRQLPPELGDAARVDGAGPGRELGLVVWPLTAFAALQTKGAVAVLTFGELGASKLAETPGSQTFAHEVFNQMHYGVTADLAALCLLLLAVGMVGAILVAVSGRIFPGVLRASGQKSPLAPPRGRGARGE